MICGHKDLSDKFIGLAKKGSLGHGYVFFGEPQVGKFSFALSLVNFLETGNFDIPVKMLSEVLVIKQTGIDSVREIKNFLWQKPQNSPKRTVIIDAADSLTAEAQNAILKITEEPPEHSLIILIANNTDNLLPPIVSRLHKIYFGRVSEKEVGDFLVKHQGIKVAEAKKIAAESYGRPGMALDILNSEELKKVKTDAEKFLKLSGFARPQFIKNFIEEQKERPELLDAFFTYALIKLRGDAVANHLQIKALLSRFFLIKSYNVNKRLQMEAL